MTQTIRVIDLETTGSTVPGHHVCEIGWQDVDLHGERWEVGDGGSTLIDPQRRIPAVTSAIHHIVDADVAGAPKWLEAAPAILRPDTPLLALAAHRAAFEQRWCTPALTGGTPWICTWKGALRVFPDSPSFSNQVLRYWRNPAGLERERSLPAHRAGPDAYVTAFHLRDMLNAVGPEALIGWEREPGLLPRVPRGYHRGLHWHELDTETLQGFAQDRDEDMRFSARHELARRGGASPESQRRQANAQPGLPFGLPDAG